MKGRWLVAKFDDSLGTTPERLQRHLKRLALARQRDVEQLPLRIEGVNNRVAVLLKRIIVPGAKLLLFPEDDAIGGIWIGGPPAGPRSSGEAER